LRGPDRLLGLGVGGVAHRAEDLGVGVRLPHLDGCPRTGDGLPPDDVRQVHRRPGQLRQRRFQLRALRAAWRVVPDRLVHGLGNAGDAVHGDASTSLSDGHHRLTRCSSSVVSYQDSSISSPGPAVICPPRTSSPTCSAATRGSVISPVTLTRDPVLGRSSTSPRSTSTAATITGCPAAWAAAAASWSAAYSQFSWSPPGSEARTASVTAYPVRPRGSRRSAASWRHCCFVSGT